MYSLEYMYSREYIRIHENTQEYTLYSCVGNTPILCGKCLDPLLDRFN